MGVEEVEQRIQVAAPAQQPPAAAQAAFESQRPLGRPGGSHARLAGWLPG